MDRGVDKPTPNAATGLRVVVADDAPLIRAAVAEFLQQRGLSVVAQTADPAATLAAVRSHRPDVLLLDVRMPPTWTTEGREVAVEVRRREPTVGIVFLTQASDGDLVREVLARTGDQESGLGLIRKEESSGDDRLLTMVTAVAAGDVVVDASVGGDPGRWNGKEPRSRVSTQLTSREREILFLMSQGLTNAGIAACLTLSVRTVENHIARLFGRLGLTGADDPQLHRRVCAVVSYLTGIDRGSIPPAPP
ncbi:MAG: response regulator transcription factor [Phycicoccus sp.]